MEVPKSLAVIFLEEKEVTKKIFQLTSVKQLVQTCKDFTGTDDAWCYRILKYNPDFSEFIDTDMNDTIEHMDKFNVFFKCSGSSVLVSVVLFIPVNNTIYLQKFAKVSATLGKSLHYPFHLAFEVASVTIYDYRKRETIAHPFSHIIVM